MLLGEVEITLVEAAAVAEDGSSCGRRQYLMFRGW